MLFRWLKAVRAATAELAQDVEITQWKGSLFEDEPYVDNYREFRKLRGDPVPPLEAPETLPGLPKGLDPGQLPTAEELRQSLADADSAVLHPEVSQTACWYVHYDRMMVPVKSTFMPDMQQSFVVLELKRSFRSFRKEASPVRVAGYFFVLVRG